MINQFDVKLREGSKIDQFLIDLFILGVFIFVIIHIFIGRIMGPLDSNIHPNAFERNFQLDEIGRIGKVNSSLINWGTNDK
jgi:hypothetical protein